MKKYLFSIIIPIYNSKSFLKKCIESVINQNLEGIQIILINDCSTDGSKGICKKYQKKYNFDLINHKKRLGVAESRNNGLKRSKGRYIIFLDSDDYFLKNALVKIKKTILSNNYPEVILNNCKRNRVPENFNYILKNFKNKLINKVNFFHILNRNKIILNDCWNLAISRKLIFDNKIFFRKIKIIEDIGFILKIFVSMKNIAINKHTTLFHLSRLGSLKHTLGTEAAYSYLITLIDLNELLKKYYHNRLIKKYLEFRIKRVAFYYGSYSSLLNQKETLKLSVKSNNIFKKLYNIKNINFVVRNNSERKNSLNFIKKYQNYVKNQVMFSLKKAEYKKKEIYVFCADVAARSFIKILYKNKIAVKKIYDDDLNFRGKKIFNIPISRLPNKKFKLKNLKSAVFLICNYDKKTFKKISTKLISKGLLKNQIHQLYY